MIRLPPWLRQALGDGLPLWLALQAVLVFSNLELLPIWGDEQFTLNVIGLDAGKALAALRADIHPPLYYFLVSAWADLPFDASLISRVRAFSGLWALLSTLLIYRLWVRDLPSPTRLWFFALWALSPALVLYARIGRSYTLQLFLACLLLYFAARFVRAPDDRRAAAAYTLTATVLLYVHYLPALALMAATAAWLVVRCFRERTRGSFAALVIPHAAVLLFYAPWAATLAGAIRRVAVTESYSLVDSWWGEALIRLLYWFCSFTFGETLPPWGIAVAGAISLPAVWMIGKRIDQRLQDGDADLGLALLGAAVAFLGASSWVSFAAVPGRVLFLLPLYLLLLAAAGSVRPIASAVIRGAILFLGVVSLTSYFHKTDFFNKGYLIPFDEMAERIENSRQAESSLVVIDGYNCDPGPFVAAIENSVDTVVVNTRRARRRAREKLRPRRRGTIWHLRGTHDISPGRFHDRLEKRLRRLCRADLTPYLPYSAHERRFLAWTGRPAPPEYHYRLTRFSCGPRGRE